MERNKKIIIGAVIALGIVALGVGAYIAWQNRGNAPTVVVPESNEGAILPFEPVAENLRVISSRQVSGYWVVTATSGSVLMYADLEGNIMKVDDAGDELIYAQSIANIAAVKPSGDGSRAFVESKDGGVSLFHLFDAVVGLPGVTVTGVAEVTWAPKGNSAAYVVSTGDAMRLRTQTADLIGQSDAAKFSDIVRLPQGDIVMHWPQKDVLYVAQRPSADYVSDAWRVDMKTKSMKKIASDRGLMMRWAPFGTRALKFTTTEGRKHRLTIVDDGGSELATVKFVTLPDKCVMTAPTQMYCAIPRDQEALMKMTLPDDYLKRDVYTQDGIYQIDSMNNGIRAIYEADEPVIDATDLTVLGDRIVFINRYDRKLYSLNLQ